MRIDEFIRYHYGNFEKMCDYYEENYPIAEYKDDKHHAFIACYHSKAAGFSVLEFYAHFESDGIAFDFPLLSASDKGEVLRKSLRGVLGHAPFSLSDKHRDCHMRRCISKRRNLFEFVLSPSALMDRLDFLEQVCHANDYPFIGASFMSVLYKKVFRHVRDV